MFWQSHTGVADPPWMKRASRRCLGGVWPQRSRRVDQGRDGSAGFLTARASSRIKAGSKQLEASLRGRVTKHHRFPLKLHWDHIDALEAAIACIGREVDGNVESFRQAARLL